MVLIFVFGLDFDLSIFFLYVFVFGVLYCFIVIYKWLLKWFFWVLSDFFDLLFFFGWFEVGFLFFILFVLLFVEIDICYIFLFIFSLCFIIIEVMGFGYCFLFVDRFCNRYFLNKFVFIDIYIFVFIERIFWNFVKLMCKIFMFIKLNNIVV